MQPLKHSFFVTKHDSFRRIRCNDNQTSTPGFLRAQGFKDDTRLRHSILSILYVERRNGSADSAIGLWRMEKILGWPENILEFHIWYLKEKDWIQCTDTGGYAITAAGVDIVEEHNLIVSEDRLLTDNRKSPADDDLVEETVENKKSGLQLISKKV